MCNPNRKRPLIPYMRKCNDDRGTAVRLLNSDSEDNPYYISMINVRYLDQANIAGPSIIYDEDFVKQLSPIQLQFTMAHECYHLSSGDARAAYEHLNFTGKAQSRDELQHIENDADCGALNYMQTQMGYARKDFDSEINALFHMVQSSRKADARYNALQSCDANTSIYPGPGV